MVSAELGQPEATAVLETEADDWHFAAWRTTSAAVVVAQGEEFSSYGEPSMAAIWVLPHESGDPLPADGAGFYSWLLGED
ncbi:hypothetical protein AB0C76_04650 [Kitasatospora sp. NPDC048722]|uniref:hypothetical protein n=1 Tax=Kitasatospora sp. NPDC048722 TaxID=3155639 RepID=UPI0033D8F409